MSDILYRPNLDYEKNYYTEGSFQSNTETETNQSTTSTITSTTGLDKINEKLQRIETLLPSLPNDIANALTPVIKGAKYIYNQINPENYNDDYVNSTSSVVITPSDDSTTTSTSSSTIDENEDDDGPDGIFSDLIPLIDVKVNKKNPVDAINIEYDNTIASILEDYLNNLQIRLNKYYTKINVSANEAGVTNLKSVVSTYEVKTTDLKNKNLYHVADLVVKTQIARDQKTRLFKKLFSLTETTSHVRACKVAKDLRTRYYEEKKVPSNDFLDLTKNIMLFDSKQIYDKKYKENLCNLYKYLNSSVILIDECLSMFVQEAQAKMILIKEEGIKL
jgi:hypothetical protein